MVRALTLAIILGLTVSGCHDVAPTALPEEASWEVTSNEFTVDSFSVGCAVALNPGSGTPTSWFSYVFVYRFAHLPGGIDTVRFSFDSLMNVGFLPYQLVPDSVGVSYRYSPRIGMGNTFIGLDSVSVRCEIVGRYWDIVDGKKTVFGKFAWASKQKIGVARE